MHYRTPLPTTPLNKCNVRRSFDIRSRVHVIVIVCAFSFMAEKCKAFLLHGVL